LSFLQGTQELRLCGKKKVEDLIEEKTSALGKRELSGLQQNLWVAFGSGS
jgi:hypothetical protein